MGFVQTHKIRLVDHPKLLSDFDIFDAILRDKSKPEKKKSEMLSLEWAKQANILTAVSFKFFQLFLEPELRLIL